jgi:hypothetical protein
MTASRLPDLHSLHIWYARVDLDSFCRLILASPSLRSFYGANLTATDRCFKALADNCPHLQVLSFCEGTLSTLPVLVLVFHGCPLIEVVNMSTVPRTTDLDAVYEHISAILQHCALLKAFSAAGHGVEITDAPLLAVAQRLRDLRHLRLYDCNPTTDAPILAIAENCGNLRALELRALNAIRVSQQALTALVSNLKLFEELTLFKSHVSDQVLRAIAEHCPRLVALNLIGSWGHTEAAMAEVARGCGELRVVRVDEANLAITPSGRLWWKVFRPRIQLLHSDAEGTVWAALQDVGRKEFVVW